MKTSLLIIIMLAISIFLTGVTIADDSSTIEDSIAQETASEPEEVIPATTDASEISEISEEAEKVAPEQLAAKQLYAGVARVSVGEGFAINSDKTKAERISALWTSAKYISVEQSAVKNIRNQYKGQQNKIKEEIAKLATDKVVVRASGRLAIGFGNNKEKFKIMKKEFNNKSVSFYLFPINTNLAELKNLTDSDISAKSIGTLNLDATVYPDLTIWGGKIILTSKKYSGTWDVTAYSHSKTFEKTNLKKERQESKEKLELKKDEGKIKKPPLIKRLMFWKKASADE